MGFALTIALAFGVRADIREPTALLPAGAIILALFVTGGMTIYKRFLRPLYQILGVVERYRNGDTSVRTSIAVTDEIGKLAVAINEMLDGMQARASEAHKLAIVAERTDEPILLLDAEEKIEWVNGAFTKLTKQSFDDVLGQDFCTWVTEFGNDEERLMEIKQALVNRQGLHVEVCPTLTLDMSPIEPEAGNVTGFMAILAPVRPLEITEEQRRLEQFEEFFRQAPCGYHSLDGDGNIVSMNDTELRWLGAKREDVIGGPFLSFVDKRFHEALQARVLTVDGREELEWTECEIIRADGAHVPVLLSALAKRSPEGRLLHAYCTVVDFAGRKRTEEQSERAGRMKNEFLANMSHELRTPLNAVLGLTEVLLDGFLGSLNLKQKSALETIHESGHHLLSLINDILDLSKAEAGYLKLTLTSVLIDDVCTGSLNMIRIAAEQRNIEIVYRLQVGAAFVTVEPRRFKQCLINLLSNAIKFTHSGGQVGLEVNLDPTGRQIIFAVWDTGIGISSDDQARLFQPFFQVSTGLARNYEGTGLGLSLTKRLVELHGGTLRLESTYGKGSRFEIILPIDAQASNMSDSVRSGEPGRRSTISLLAPSATQNEAIVADEDERCVELVTTYLQVRGYSVTGIRNGAQLLGAIKEQWPMLIVMDVEMPGVPTIETIRQLYRDVARPRNLVIALVKRDSNGDQQACLAADADERLSKPVVLKELGGVVHRWHNNADANAE